MNVLWNEFVKKVQDSALIAEKDPYGVKYAGSGEDVRACQQLRFRVFNQEQGKYTGTLSNEQIDHDDFVMLNNYNSIKHGNVCSNTAKRKNVVGNSTQKFGATTTGFKPDK